MNALELRSTTSEYCLHRVPLHFLFFSSVPLHLIFPTLITVCNEIQKERIDRLWIITKWTGSFDIQTITAVAICRMKRKNKRVCSNRLPHNEAWEFRRYTKKLIEVGLWIISLAIWRVRWLSHLPSGEWGDYLTCHLASEVNISLAIWRVRWLSHLPSGEWGDYLTCHLASEVIISLAIWRVRRLSHLPPGEWDEYLTGHLASEMNL